MSKFLLNALFLLTAAGLAFIWTNSPSLSYYTLQLIALFVLFFFLNQLFNRSRTTPNRLIDSTLFTVVIILLIFTTGGLSSPLFFLLYFLIFGLALLSGPAITIALSLALVVFLIISPHQGNFMTEVLQLFSLLWIAPLALFLGHQYLKSLVEEEKIRILEEEEEVANRQISKEETDVLMWTTLDLKNSLTNILDQVSQLLADISHLTFAQKEKLTRIHQQVIALLNSSEKLKEEVDKTTDE